jgi:hypothetical protein
LRPAARAAIYGAAVSDIFQEVDEDVRRERFEKLLRRYAKPIIAGVVVLVLLVAGGSYWRQYRVEQARTAGSRFNAAALMAQQGKESDAAVAFTALAEQAGPGYAMLARLREAGARAKAGDLPGALALYDKLAADSALPKEFRDLAAIGAAFEVLDKGDAAEAERRAEAIAGKDHTYRWSAREASALAALKAGQIDKARERLTALVADADAPAGIQKRAADVLAALGRKG